ncbi:hypothetical protein HAX54_045487, partial [Datura stramonium]|nr:hypothetical protein [Datura stramonium]
MSVKFTEMIVEAEACDKLQVTVAGDIQEEDKGELLDETRQLESLGCPRDGLTLRENSFREEEIEYTSFDTNGEI